MAEFPMSARPPGRAPLSRRLVVVGVVRRTPGRVFSLTATPAGATGRISPTGGAR